MKIFRVISILVSFTNLKDYYFVVAVFVKKLGRIIVCIGYIYRFEFVYKIFRLVFNFV